ncbi:MAG: 1,4-alpha-glucan branching enzyme, partial [Thermodesulfobacteriota bacterium]|nr:1,4-alpha-glucan branching enzyme [Thermodesulfobacteriota bacterium]
MFEALIPGPHDFAPYRLEVEFKPNHRAVFYDCYSFTPVLSDYDLYLFNQGNHYQLHEKLGAHLWRHQDVSGVLFAVWAPSARRVSVVGEFN